MIDRIKALEWLTALLTLPAGAGIWVLIIRAMEWRRGRGERSIGASERLFSHTHQLADQLQEEVTRVSALLVRYSAEIELLRSARWQVVDSMGELRDAAIAARTLVHELQRRLGEEETSFPPLPVFPVLGGRPGGPSA